ncbi:MAG: beta-class carbonic anhydrase [Bacillota bacterium]
MSLIQEIMEFNREFVEQKSYEAFRTSKFPDKKVVILGCMDTRLLELLPKAMNLKNGDAKIIKNAGAIITNPFDSVVRSILVAIYELKAEEVLIVGHHQCGMAGLNMSSVLEKAKQRGVTEEQIDTLTNAGVDLSTWLTGFNTVEESVANSVNVLKNHPLFPKHVPVHGMVIDPETSELDLVVVGYSLESGSAV